ncbi:MAG: D-alanyl-D-alanine carboxypeptidase [Clostridia bacterium]|nr:D-alanyl-D-alanine carboxypeptidase [Clostridia bacterium]
MFTLKSSAIRVAAGEDLSDIAVPIEASVTNAAIGSRLEISAKSVVLLEAKTGQVLYEDNPSEKLPPASITKVMSLLLVMEAIDRGDMSLEDVITASEHAASMGGSQIWLEPGETMTVDELLKATVIASANDATVALGEAIAGSEEGFVAMMNQKAKSLGMNNTHFVNCTGLDAEGHLTTAYDIAIMSCELIKHPLIKNYSTVWMDSLRGGESELVNTNKLIRYYSGATGLKTGTTSGAGYCVSATAERDGMELVAVVMGGSTSAERFNGAKKLLDYGFANYSFKEYSPKIEKDTYVKVLKGEKTSVKAECKGAVNILSEKSDKDNITTKINLSDTVTAPIKKGDKIGSVSVYLGDEEIGTVDITAADNVKRLTFKSAVIWLITALFKA